MVGGNGGGKGLIVRHKRNACRSKMRENTKPASMLRRISSANGAELRMFVASRSRSHRNFACMRIDVAFDFANRPKKMHAHASGASLRSHSNSGGSMLNLRRATLALILSAFVTLLTAPSFAQTWPQRPVHFIIPLGPGSGVDITARVFADNLSAKWGQPVVVENKPGGRPSTWT